MRVNQIRTNTDKGIPYEEGIPRRKIEKENIGGSTRKDKWL